MTKIKDSDIYVNDSNFGKSYRLADVYRGYLSARFHTKNYPDSLGCMYVHQLQERNQIHNRPLMKSVVSKYTNMHGIPTITDGVVFHFRMGDRLIITEKDENDIKDTKETIIRM